MYSAALGGVDEIDAEGAPVNGAGIGGAEAMGSRDGNETGFSHMEDMGVFHLDEELRNENLEKSRDYVTIVGHLSDCFDKFAAIFVSSTHVTNPFTRRSKSSESCMLDIGLAQSFPQYRYHFSNFGTYGLAHSIILIGD